MSLSLNGVMKQTDQTGNMIFKPHETLTELSHLSNLRPGDMLLTGSPGGFALSVPPKFLTKILGLFPEALKWKLFIKGQSKNTDYLKAGDQITARIVSADGKIDLGTQETRVSESTP